jgi:membrane-bound ClpP family serine protease
LVIMMVIKILPPPCYNKTEMMTGRLIVAIFTTLAEEAALAAIVLWGLPRLGVNLHVGVLIALMAALATFAVITYRMGSRALKKKPVVGLTDMVGARGRAVSDLAPEGTVRIKGELWESRAEGRRISAGTNVTVVGQDGLKLIVRREKPSRKSG